MNFKEGEVVKGNTRTLLVCKSDTSKVCACEYCCFHIDGNYNCTKRREAEINISEDCDMLLGDSSGVYYFKDITGGL